MALAERAPVELVSMDSAQVYRGLDVGTAKPSAAERARVPRRLTGKPLSALQGATRSSLPFALKAFALVPAEREALHERNARRFDAMLKAGLVDEVHRLRSRYRLTLGMPSMRAGGYRQVWQYL